jgi:hypothetical protein
VFFVAVVGYQPVHLDDKAAVLRAHHVPFLRLGAR